MSVKQVGLVCGKTRLLHKFLIQLTLPGYKCWVLVYILWWVHVCVVLQDPNEQGRLYILFAQYEQSGLYTCVATTQVDTATHSAYVTVTGKFNLKICFVMSILWKEVWLCCILFIYLSIFVGLNCWGYLNQYDIWRPWFGNPNPY